MFTKIKDVYSNKDSNRNRMLEERESYTFIYIILTAIGSFAAIFLYYNYMLLPSHPIPPPPRPAVEYVPPPWTYPKGQAKPYDTNKPPYEQ
jgi:hypothetical protein